jgi:broad specificity phosphatase PhoE
MPGCEKNPAMTMIHAYLSHPQVAVDPAVPVPHWGLSELGRRRAGLLASGIWLHAFAKIVTSAEAKALETGRILSEAAGIPMESREGMHENDRSATGFLPPDEFETVADAFFAEPIRSVRGWERAADAQARIVAEIAAELDHAEGPVLFVGHGAVGTLLLCHLAGMPIRRRDPRPAPDFPVGDQPAGGGNAYRFTWNPRQALTGWTRIEDLD